MAAAENQSTVGQVKKKVLIRSQLEDTRTAFHDLLESLTSEDLHKPSGNPAWSIGEVLYHMSFAPRNLPLDVWMIRHLKWLPKIPAGPFNRINTYLTRQGGRSASKAGIANAYDEAHQRTLKVLESIKGDEWQKGAEYPGWDPMLSGFVTLERLFEYINLHFTAHAEEIKGALTENEVHD